MAEDALKISINNRDDSDDRVQFRYLMESIKSAASLGRTRFITDPNVKKEGWHFSGKVQDALRSFGYRVVEKRAYKFDTATMSYSDKPDVNAEGREQFFLEITWG